MTIVNARIDFNGLLFDIYEDGIYYTDFKHEAHKLDWNELAHFMINRKLIMKLLQESKN